MDAGFELTCLNCSSRSGSIFSDLEPGDLGMLSSVKVCTFRKRGEIVYTEGGVPHGLYCVHQGKVKILRTGESGRETILRVAASGSVLGYRVLLSEDVYDNTAVSLSDSHICFIPRTHFVDLVTHRPELASKVLGLLSSDLKAVEEQVLGISQKPIIERVAETLLVLLESFGFASDGMTLDLELTREELAGIVGAVPESTIRALSKLRSYGLVDLSRRHIAILDRSGLAQAANLPD